MLATGNENGINRIIMEFKLQLSVQHYDQIQELIES